MENCNAGRGAVQVGKEVVLRDYRAQFYTFPHKIKAETSDAMIPITILLCERMDNVLFNP